jgi:hypothetical protein
MKRSEVLLIEDNAGDALLVGQALAEALISVHLLIARDGDAMALHQRSGPTSFRPRSLFYMNNIFQEKTPALSGDAEQRQDKVSAESSANRIENLKAVEPTALPGPRLSKLKPKPPEPPMAKWRPIPKWLIEVICGKDTLAEKRDALEVALAQDDEFVEWALLELFHQCTVPEKADLTPKGRNGRGFGLCLGEIFMSMARYSVAHDSLTEKQLAWLRSLNAKGRSKLGKHGEQLVAIIAAANCPKRVSRKFARLLDVDKEVA